MDQGFADWFETPVEQFLFAFATPFGQERATQMRQWCEQELTRLNQTHKAPIMFFAALPEELDPAVIFLSPLWEAACESGKCPLVSLS